MEAPEEDLDPETAHISLSAAREVNVFLNAENAQLTAKLQEKDAEVADLKELVARLRSEEVRLAMCVPPNMCLSLAKSGQDSREQASGWSCTTGRWAVL